MDTSRPMQMMEALGYLDWHSIVFGWKHGWVSRQALVDYAIYWLQSHPNETNRAIALLAASEEYDTREILDLLSEIAEKQPLSKADEKDKWRVAHLKALLSEELSAETKLDCLEALYAEFGYPEDMRLCSRYGPSVDAIKKGFASADDIRIAPLAAASQLVEHLARRLGGKE